MISSDVKMVWTMIELSVTVLEMYFVEHEILVNLVNPQLNTFYLGTMTNSSASQ